MILFYSGTGNSAYAAKRIAGQIGDDAIDLLARFQNKDDSALHSETPWVIVTPTYGWRIPRILQNWLERTELTGNKKIYFVMTCGGSAGNADKYLRKLCVSRRLEYQGCFPIVMPENYIALFSAPDRKEALQIIEKADPCIDQAAKLIYTGKAFPSHTFTMKDNLNSGVVNVLYYPLLVHAKKFYATDACVSCGQCAAVCPLNNIRLENGKPSWGKDCTHCMACICRCPKEAIEYGKHTQGMIRYTCPK